MRRGETFDSDHAPTRATIKRSSRKVTPGFQRSPKFLFAGIVCMYEALACLREIGQRKPNLVRAL